VPELPEVETVVRILRPHLLGRRCGEVQVQWKRTLGGSTRAALRKRMTGARIGAVERRGKYIVIELERRGASAGCVVVHLRMTGRLYVDRRGEGSTPWTRVVVGLDRGDELCFDDVRKFGRFVPAASAQEVHGELGPEPLEAGFTGAWLSRALAGRKRMLKPLLLDQLFIAGLGNIYVDESLFGAGLHPCERSDRVGPERAKRLQRRIRAVLRAAIEREGSSFDTFYRTPEGQPGSYQHQFQVYGRTGRPCRRCKTPIVRIVVGQRGTHFCPRCQPRPRVHR